MSEEIREVQWFNPSDKKLHTCKIDIGNDEPLDLTELLKTTDNVAKNNEDFCKKIYYLGVGLTGSVPGGRGFLDGWLVRSLRDNFEKTYGKWNIQHEAETLSSEELKSHFVKILRETADKIENEDDFDPKNAPVVKSKDDGTDLF